MNNKILLVEDDLVSLRMLDSILNDQYEISVATTGDQALKRAILAPPDLVLLDIGLGDMDGYEVFRYLASNDTTRDIPVIFVTAMASETEEKKGLELGAADYIIKPYRPSIIRARVHNQLELKRQRDLLNYLSCQDSLTGLANRRGFDLFLDQVWQSAKRYNEDLALIYMDVDNFSQYNDLHGYLTGNKCLVKVAELLKSCLRRKTDLLARYNDDEFVCVLSRTDLQGALYVARKIQVAVITRAIPYTYSERYECISLSYGVTAVKPAETVSDVQRLVETAARLLRQKNDGTTNKIYYDAEAV